jgi:hypothetical protein
MMSMLVTEAVVSPETSTNFYQTIQRHIPNDSDIYIEII